MNVAFISFVNFVLHLLLYKHINNFALKKLIVQSKSSSNSCPMALLRQFALGANVPLYVMATGYDIDIVPSGIIFQCSVYCSID